MLVVFLMVPSVAKFSSGYGLSTFLLCSEGKVIKGCWYWGGLVEESSKAWDRAVEVPRGMTSVLQVGFGVPHVLSVVGVGREHMPVLAGLGTLDGKLVGEGLPSQVQSLLLEGDEG